VKGKIKKVSLQDVIEVASRQEPKMTLIMRELINRI
jgi:purine-nucleoside phosphorylase